MFVPYCNPYTTILIFFRTTCTNNLIKFWRCSAKRKLISQIEYNKALSKRCFSCQFDPLYMFHSSTDVKQTLTVDKLDKPANKQVTAKALVLSINCGPAFEPFLYILYRFLNTFWSLAEMQGSGIFLALAESEASSES